jgi:hypothetical protein
MQFRRRVSLGERPIATASRMFTEGVESRPFANASWKDGSAPPGDAVAAAYKRLALAELPSPRTRCRERPAHS